MKRPAGRPADAASGRGYTLLSLAGVVAAGAAFWRPALRATGGAWPAPLDDVYIHFAFARSAALAHPFQWVVGNGYSSGGTSLLYPLVLAPGWLLGLRDTRLGLFAAVVALASLVDLGASLRRLVARDGRAPAWVRVFATLVPLSVPLLDWSWFSGMETALVGAVLGRVLVATDRASSAPAHLRAAAQWRAGVWCAALVAARPELVALSLPLALAVVHGARSLSTATSLARAFAPTLLLLGVQAAANAALTGEIQAAGAVRKLVTTNPYAPPASLAVEVIRNLVVLRAQALDAALGGAPWSWAAPALGLVALAARRTRRLGAALGVGALVALLLVALNTTARFQNLRYAAPILAMLLSGATLGAARLARGGRLARSAGIVLALVVIAAPARWFPVQIEHFARASRNIAQQQVVVARRLAALSPRPRRVLVGDAGAIPYLSGLGALDGLGLGGYHDLPFARASVHGIPAVVELIERLPEGERPDWMALYATWWPDLVASFGRRVDSVRITDNVICGSDEKTLYRADWSALAVAGEQREGQLDAVDVADLVDERIHDYDFPHPLGGWVIGASRRDAAGHLRFDGGRIVPQGRAEHFVVGSSVVAGPGRLVLRTDAPDVEIRVTVRRAGSLVGQRTARLDAVSGPTEGEPAPGGPADGSWYELTAALPSVAGGDRIDVEARRGAWRSFHTWLVRP